MTTLTTPTARPRPPSRTGLEPAILKALVLTGATLFSLLVGLAGARLWESVAVTLLGYGVAYLAGGLPATRAALKTLFQERKLNIDLLMILAALGAASIGQFADGAILLFLFSPVEHLAELGAGAHQKRRSCADKAQS